MKRMIAAGLLTAMLCALSGRPAHTAPQASEVAIDWELDFQYKHLQAIKLQVPAEAAPRLFWYLRYQVTNHTDADRVFIPSFALYTRTGQLIRSGQNVPVHVFHHIKKMFNDPFLKDISGMTGKLLQGEDNAKDGVAIWPDFDPAAGTVKIFVAGLSGETAEIKLPKPVWVTEIDVLGNTKKVSKSKLVLSKTLQLTYSIPGEPQSRLYAPVNVGKKKWIMR